jgi:hypothetical protein
MAYSFVQTKTNAGVTVSTVTVTLDAPTTKGDLIVVGVALSGTSVTINTPTDDKSNSYSTTVGPTDSGDGTSRIKQFSAVDLVGGMTQVTVTLSGNGTYAVFVDVFHGGPNAGVLGQTSTGTGTSTTPAVTSFSPRAGSLIVALTRINANQTWTAGTNYTLGSIQARSASEYRLISTTTETAPFSGTASGVWVEVAAEFLPGPPAQAVGSLPVRGGLVNQGLVN